MRGERSPRGLLEGQGQPVEQLRRAEPDVRLRASISSGSNVDSDGSVATPSCTECRVRSRLVPKTRIEVAVRSDLVDQVVEAILKSAKTGKVGDGKIFITEIERVIRIRTGETDDAALEKCLLGPWVTRVRRARRPVLTVVESGPLVRQRRSARKAGNHNGELMRLNGLGDVVLIARLQCP